MGCWLESKNCKTEEISFLQVVIRIRIKSNNMSEAGTLHSSIPTVCFREISPVHANGIRSGAEHIVTSWHRSSEHFDVMSGFGIGSDVYIRDEIA